MDRLFVDTSAWYAYLNRKDPGHAAVAAALAPWEGRIVLTDYVFDELMTLLRMRIGHEAAVRVGELLRSGEVGVLANVEPEDFERAWRQFRREKDKQYSFTDCTSFAVMRRLGIRTAAALDVHFQQAGFEVLPSPEGP
jgi:predicted nucleic acid-binding protein